MVLFTAWHLRKQFQGQQVFWIVDNSSSLFCLIKGASNNLILERIVACFHIVCFWFRITVYFEYVDSKSNFSDCISRKLDQDPFCQQLGLKAREFESQAFWFEDELATIWSLVESGVGGD